MPWCPICKTEYREGITHCADCKTELVADLNVRTEKLKNATAMVVKVAGNQDGFIQKFASFLEYSNVTAQIVEEKDGSLAVYTEPQELNNAKRLFKAFYSVESERIQKAAEEAFLAGREVEEAFFAEDNTKEQALTDVVEEEDEEDLEEEAQEVSAKRYGSAISRYEDYRSSGSVFMVLGVLGIVFSVLNLCDVLFIFNTFSSIVSLVFFSFFLGMSIFSYVKAGKIKGAALKEKELVAAVNQWLSENVTEESLHAFDEVSVKNIATEDAETLARTEEILYLNRIDSLREAVVQLFPDLNPSFAEQIIEDYYAKHFDDEEE